MTYWLVEVYYYNWVLQNDESRSILNIIMANQEMSSLKTAWWFVEIDKGVNTSILEAVVGSEISELVPWFLQKVYPNWFRSKHFKFCFPFSYRLKTV